MTRALILAALLAAPLAGPGAAAGAGAPAGWVAMVEGCVTYAESGQLSAGFSGWRMAAAQGFCAGGPGCESDEMTFVAPDGTGAVTVTVGAADWAAARPGEAQDRQVGDRPRHLSCTSAAGTGHTTESVRALHGAWVAQAVSGGRLVEGGVFADELSGPYLGCGYDGRPFQVEFSLMRGGAAVLRLYLPAREGAAEGMEPGCTRTVG